MIRRALMLSAVLAIGGLVSCTTLSPTTSKRVFFVEPADGAVVTSPFVVKFGLAGMELKPAGDETPNSGHHHILVNMESMPEGQTIPFSERHIHFGKAQTEGEIKLPPGVYTLTMQFASKDHLSFGKGMSQSIRITVK